MSGLQGYGRRRTVPQDGQAKAGGDYEKHQNIPENLMRISRVRTTDFRTTAGLKRPLEAGRPTRGGSMTGLERLEANQKAEATNADEWVRGLSVTALRGIAGDLARDLAWDRKGALA